jgi:ABC-2 type transport system permease protein
MLRRIWSLSVKEFIHLKNDWWMPVFMVFGGVLELLLVGWATSRPISNLPIVILDHDRSSVSRQIITELKNTNTFTIQQHVDNYDQIQDQMVRGEIIVAIIFPPDFQEQIIDYTGQAQLSIILNGAESVPAIAALRAIEGVTQSFSKEIIFNRLKINPADQAGFSPSLRVWFNEALSEAYYTTPAELALMLEFTVLLFAALSFSRERELGTLEQLLVMPFTAFEIIIGKAIPVIIISFLDFLLMLGMVHYAFGVPIKGSLLLLLILAFGYLLVELSKGMVLSVISKSQHQAFLLVLVIGMVDFMFTGYAAPVESMPVLVQWIANFIPANHWLTIVRGILLKGADMSVLWPSVAALAAIGLVIGVFSLRYVRKALD